MNAVQLRYMKARAALDAAQELAAALRPPYPDPDTDAALEGYVKQCASAESAAGYYPAFDAYITARDALLAWGRDKALAYSLPERRAEIAALYDNVVKFPSILRKLIGATMRLDA